MHGCDDVQLGTAGVGDLEVDERLRDDAVDAAATGQDLVGDDAHQAAMPAAIDKVDAARSHAPGQVPRPFGEAWVAAHACPAINRQTLHSRSFTHRARTGHAADARRSPK
jgi:hypothetical protein